MIRLLLKTYNNGKKYLCKTVRDDYLEYRGSGNNVTSDLSIVDTEVLFESNDSLLFRDVAVYYSELWDVDINPLFLNECYEEGQGGSTGDYSWVKDWYDDRRNNNSYKLLKKYQKRFRFKLMTAPGQNLCKMSDKWLDAKLKEVVKEYGQPEEVNWEYERRGRRPSNGKAISRAVAGKTSGKVTVINKEGYCTKIPKEEYFAQKIGNSEDWHWVTNNSIEGKKRRLLGG